MLVQHTVSIVSPMLHRVEVCRNLVLENTHGNFDILDAPAFIRYKNILIKDEDFIMKKCNRSASHRIPAVSILLKLSENALVSP